MINFAFFKFTSGIRARARFALEKWALSSCAPESCTLRRSTRDKNKRALREAINHLEPEFRDQRRTRRRRDGHGRARPRLRKVHRNRLFHLTTDDATDMLRTIRTATGNEADATSPRPRADPAAEPEPHAPATLVPPPRPPEGAKRPPVRLDMLGDVHLHTADGPIKTGLRQRARDLLAYLALHPEGVTRDRASADLWPDDSLETITSAFNTAVTNVRNVLRNATGLNSPMYIVHSAGRYRIDPDVIDVDLWQLTAALADAQKATDNDAKIRALTLVADRCVGDFATGLTQQWAEAQREYLRRTVGNALTNLARLLQQDDPEHALMVLEQAIIRDPYSEPLYRHVMRLQASLDRPDAVSRTYQLLAARLGELDAEPDDETRKIMNLSTRPTAGRQRPGRPADSRDSISNGGLPPAGS